MCHFTQKIPFSIKPSPVRRLYF